MGDTCGGNAHVLGRDVLFLEHWEVYRRNFVWCSIRLPDLVVVLLLLADDRGVTAFATIR